MNKCLKCEKETYNPKFCSRSCAAKYNNVKYPKRSKEGYCKLCKSPIKSVRTYCDDCFKEAQRRDWSTVTIGEMRRLRNYQAHSRIRELARSTYIREINNPLCCAKCGYANIVHICHIKPIGEFLDSDFVTDVNNLDNLIALCPNHHWELDHNILSLGFTEFDTLHS